MEIHISMGQWISEIINQMSKASDGDLFLLPTLMHLHAFEVVKDSYFPEKHIKVKVQQ